MHVGQNALVLRPRVARCRHRRHPAVARKPTVREVWSAAIAQERALRVRSAPRPIGEDSAADVRSTGAADSVAASSREDVRAPDASLLAWLAAGCPTQASFA